MKLLSDALLGFMAGLVITLGATAYLLLDNIMAGALMFTVGLFAICSFGWNLFTGKVCYSIGKGPRYIGFLAVVWLSNFAGAATGGALLRLTRLTAAVERAGELAVTKLSDSFLSVFILAIFCNVLIYIAVEGYRSIKSDVGRHLAIFFGVTVFVVCGFEHCIANMFYFTASGAWFGSLQGAASGTLHNPFVFIAVNTAGNIVGGLLLPVLKLLSEKCARIGEKAEVSGR